MSDQVLCPHCRKALAWGESLAGRQVGCPHCGGQFLMPPSEGPVPVSVETPTPFGPPPPSRPGGVTAIAVIGIILAAIGLTCLTCAGSMMAVPEASEKISEAIAEQQLPAAWIAISLIYTVLSSIALLVISINLLRLRPWARKGFLILAVIAFVGAMVNFGMNLTHGPKANPAEQIGQVFGFLVGLAYWVIGFLYLRQEKIKITFGERTDSQVFPSTVEG